MADADLLQYNIAGADAETANGENALTGSLLVVQDGKKITATSNGVGQAPVNRSVKKIADRVAGLYGWLIGGVAGVTQRTIKSLHIDGTGGAASSALAGYCKASTAVLVQTGANVHLLTPTAMNVSDGVSQLDYSQASLGFTGTAASGANPAKTSGINNRLYALNIPKAGGIVTTDGGGGTNNIDGMNIASLSIVGGTALRITFADGFANTTYWVTGGAARHATATTLYMWKVTAKNAAYFEVTFYTDLTGASAMDLTAEPLQWEFAVHGRQTT